LGWGVVDWDVGAEVKEEKWENEDVRFVAGGGEVDEEAIAPPAVLF